VQLKGKREAVEIHECFNSNPLPDLEKRLSTLSVFNEGVSLFLNKSFLEANIAFKTVIDSDPGDHTAKFFYRNTKKIIDEGVFENGAGIVAMNEK